MPDKIDQIKRQLGEMMDEYFGLGFIPVRLDQAEVMDRVKEAIADTILKHGQWNDNDLDRTIRSMLKDVPRR